MANPDRESVKPSFNRKPDFCVVTFVFHFAASRDVPGVEVLMEQHQNRKVEIDAREDSFNDVVKMGKDLISRNHYATPEVKNHHLLDYPFLHMTRLTMSNGEWT